MIRVLGIDPGSAATGWALVAGGPTQAALEEAGVVRPSGPDRARRLAMLEQRLPLLVQRLQPDCAAVESSFSGRNPRSSLLLAESRGVILAVLGRSDMAVHSYSPAEVKSATVGHGRAEKRQIAYMVVRLLSLTKPPPEDAADAMAVALTHLRRPTWRDRC